MEQVSNRIYVALAPDLGISAQDLVVSWNAGEDRRTIATAQLAAAKPEQFEPITLAAVLVGIAAGVATDLIADLVKKALETKNPGVRLEVREITDPAGVRTLIVTTPAK